MTPKITRRAAARVAVAIVAAPSVASVVEPESDICPALPFSEEHARWLLGPLVPKPKVTHE